MKDVFSMSSGAIRLWLYLENPSIKDNIEWLDVLSTSMSICGRGKSSLGLALLRSRKSTQTLTLPSFLGIRTTLASHSGYYTIDKNLTLSCFWISFFTYNINIWYRWWDCTTWFRWWLIFCFLFGPHWSESFTCHRRRWGCWFWYSRPASKLDWICL